MEIYLNQEGKQMGPFTKEWIEGKVKIGQISLADYAWYKGCDNWISVDTLLNGKKEQVAVKGANGEQIFLNEQGVKIGSRNIQIGTTFFVVSNIGGVSIERKATRKVLPFVGLIMFGMMTLGGLIGTFASSEGRGDVAFMTLFFLLPLTIWCAVRVFASDEYYVMIAASGGLQKAYTTRKKDFATRVATAIQTAIS